MTVAAARARPPRTARAALAALLALAALAALPWPSTAVADAGETLGNWFGDPFVQLTGPAADCPTPAGPFVTEKERLLQSHHRAEKGTTAWLAGEAARPGAYAYDRDIAQALVAAFRAPGRFAGSALWATVQGRVVFIEGCVRRPSEAADIEALAGTLPFVQRAVAIVRAGPAAAVPYRVLPGPVRASPPHPGGAARPSPSTLPPSAAAR
jgi:hypothetical protein